MARSTPLPSLLPRGAGHRFVVYGDACAGVAHGRHEQTFRSTNEVVRRLDPPPEFIIFTGDEVAGLTADPAELRRQWAYWFEHEMQWLDRAAIPLFHTTGNHTTYDRMSEAVFRDVLRHLPRNGPADQHGLSYWVRRGDLLLVFVHTLWTGLGGEGHVETDWLCAVLGEHGDARHKLVVGHHPVFPVNGFSGSFQREIGPADGQRFWDVLVRADVMAYVCSHILAFDVQVHSGVLQICTAGAGTAHRMPEEIEYLHCVQAAIDSNGLRYQVLDVAGRVRETLSWPLPSMPAWNAVPRGESGALVARGQTSDLIVAFRFVGRAAPFGVAAPQTFLSAFQAGVLAPLWFGLRGIGQTLTVIIGPEPRRSPHYWLGPDIAPGQAFDITLCLHTGMGAGGILYRLGDDSPWTSLAAASPWGAERLEWPDRWSAGHAQGGPADRPFLGSVLDVSAAVWT